MHGAGHVVVDGWGPVAEEVAAQLRRCEVPVVTGAYAAEAAELALSGGGPPPGALVLASGWSPGDSAGAPWQAHGIPHLGVSTAPGSARVGPLVVPGRSACLACVEWPATSPPPPGHPLRRAPGVVVLAAAVVTVTTLSALRGEDSLGGISTEIGFDGTAVRHRFWHARPGCRCLSVRMAG
jgi:hypothetical protein